MSTDPTMQPRGTLWQRIWRIPWGLRFVCVQVGIILAVVWILLPLREAKTLPNPPLPSYTPEPPDLQETLVLGPTTYAPGAQGALRVVVYDPRSGQPIPHADVRVALAPRGHPDAGGPLFVGQTDGQGTAEVAFTLPEEVEGEWALVVDVAGRVGTQRVVRPVTVRREVGLDLETDKPRYRPGESVHLHVRALTRGDALPLAGRVVTLTVSDARDNRIWTEAVTTSAYGTAYGDCELADRVNAGTYRVGAVLGQVTVEQIVDVEPYAPPPVQLSVSTEEPYGRPGQRARATVRASGSSGRPLVDAQVEVSGTVYLPRAHPVFDVQGRTDEGGAFSLEFGVPDLVVSGLDRETNLFAVHIVARVTDHMGEVGMGEALLPVSPQPILIEAIPESGLLNGGALKPEIENAIHVRTTYPDGRPATCALTLDLPGLEGSEAQTDPSGWAEFRYHPAAGQVVTLTVVARDAQGQESRRQFEMAIEGGEHHVLLRPDRAVYRPDQVLYVEVFAPRARHAVYLDVIKEGQTVATQVALPVDGRATFDLELPVDLFGELELQAYFLPADGTVIRDARRVIVESPRDLSVSVQADREQYDSGDTANVSVHVTDGRGKARLSEVGLAVIEERSDTGWARGAWEAVNAQDRASRTVQVTGAVADLHPQRAERVSKPRPMPDDVRRQFGAVEATRAERRQVFTLLAEEMTWALTATSVTLWIAVLFTAWRGQALKLAVRSLIAGCLVGTIALPLALVGSALLAYLGGELFGPGAVIVLGMSWLGALLALFVHAWGRSDGWAQLLLVLVIGYLAIGAGLYYAIVQGAEIGFTHTVSGLGSLCAVLLAMYALGVGWTGQRQRGGALVAFALILLLGSTATGAMPRGTGAETVQALKGQAVETTQAIVAPTGVLVQPDGKALAATPSVRVAPFPTPSISGRHLGGTLYWDPAAVTDSQGSATVDIPLPELATVGRLSVRALTEDGGLGWAQARLEVSRPLAIEPELPSVLTVGDELDLPIAIHNALPISQSVRISVTQASWFRVRTRGMDVQEILIPASDVGMTYLPIRVREWGEHGLQVVARSKEARDAVYRPVGVVPAGKWISRVYSWWVDDEIDYKFRVPWSAIQGTDRVMVKLYPGRLSVIREALESAAHAPGDSFDQVAAATMAKVALAKYLRRTGEWTPGRQPEIERSLALGYQRLLTYEASQGGFSPFGTGAPDLYRSAYALRCLSELGELYPVDENLVDRTVLWLLGEQSEQGTWHLQAMPPTWGILSRAELPITAYVSWTLIDAGYGHLPGVKLAVEHLERYLDKADEPYTLALAVNVLVGYGREGQAMHAAIVRLAEMAEVKDGLAFWPSDLETLSGAAEGDPDTDGAHTPSARVERTALATLALAGARAYPELAAQGLDMLTDSRDASGTWNSPETTLLALRAFLASLPERDSSFEEPSLLSTVRVTVDEISAEPATLREDVGQTLTFDELSKGYNDVEIAAEGDEVAYQVVGAYCLPWSQVPPPSPEEEAVSIEVSYDRTTVETGDTITATVGVMLNRPGTAPLTVLELGLPPGLELVTSDLDASVVSGVLARYERAEGQVRAYLTNLSAERPVRFRYRLRAVYPLSVKTQQTRAFDVANPQRPSAREPVEIEVLGQ